MLNACDMQGMESYCIRAFAEALEVVPYTLAENAGLNPIEMVTELRNKHAQGETAAGINVRKGQVTNMMDENVVQPLLVTTSAITLACECVRMILKVPDAHANFGFCRHDVLCLTECCHACCICWQVLPCLYVVSRHEGRQQQKPPQLQCPAVATRSQHHVKGC